ncbi:gliding motility-associated C-terminal domain-containing protein [Thermoflexibacter ruber]|uniref:Gliding motility-associated C-terminal domain-containing protein n=1 Tax=Thermoflexibacter ruber TaxID=1003 RepID=A0A1I2IXH9_9BACT|nr:gliding motility-associated C-terminal domain-containing protein [Thermoflexibacter ruber]SFF47115.1 gliding motility-associated C-terminal domain-containing protein [Thermoflexibacter ruber]
MIKRYITNQQHLDNMLFITNTLYNRQQIFFKFFLTFCLLFLLHYSSNAQVATPTTSDVSRCGAGSATLTASGAPMGGSYRWYTVATGGTPIVGATSSSFTTPTLTTTTDFFVSAVSADGMSESARARATVQILPLPVAQIQQGAIIGYCGSPTLTLNAVLVGGASYQWQRFSTIGGGSFQNETGAGSNTPNYTLTSPTRGFFRVAVTGANGCTAFSPVIEVLPDFVPEAVIVQGNMGTICEGQPFTLQAKIDEFSVGNTYQWTFSPNNTTYTDITGATMNAFNATNAGFYKVRVTKNGCSATSDAIQLTQSPTPTASIQQGASASFCLGGNVVLNAQTDIGNQFLWLIGPSATGPFAPASGLNNTMTYTASSAGFYVVDITRNGCTKRSNPIEITQEPAPVAIITNPNPTSFCFGSNVTLNAQQATGNIYQWKFSTTATGTYTDIVGAVNANYQANQAGFYRVEVRKPNCSVAVLSDPIQVTETRAVIQQAPLASFCKGTTTTLNAVLVANATYQWQFSTTATGTFTNAAGTSNTATYTTGVEGFYRLNVTKDGCTHTSEVMQVKEKTATIAQGSNASFCKGGNITLIANETGTGFTYLWLFSPTLTGTYTPASGTNNAATYTASQVGFYRIRITEAGCESTSDPISVTEAALQPNADILQGASAQFCVGGDVIISVTPQPGATYQWLFSPTATGTYIPALGTNNTSNYTVVQAGFYKVKVSLGGCEVTTTVPLQASQVTSMPKPTIQQGGLATFCTGGSVSLLALLNMTGVTYQWQYSPTLAGVYVPASGVTNQQIYTTNQVGFYRVQVSKDGCGTNISDPVEVRETVNKPVAKILQTSPAQFCAGGDVLLEAQTGTGFQYRWQYSTTETGTYANAGGVNNQATYLANQVGFYRVQVTLGGCIEVSTPIRVEQTTMTPKPTIDQGTVTNLCQGGNVTLSTSLKGTNYFYLWRYSPTVTGTYTNAPGINNTANYSATQAGFYTVVVGITNCTNRAESDPIEVKLSTTKPIATILQGATAQFCVGGDVILEALQGVGYLYQWKFSATQTGTYTNAIGVSNQSNYIATEAGFYVVEVNLNGCKETSAPIAVTTTTTMPKPIILQGTLASLCQGSTLTLNAQTKSTKYTYLWEFSATQTGTYAPASGINNQDNYTVSMAGFYRLRTSSPTCGTATSDPIEIRIATEIPVAKILQGSAIQFCANGDIILEAQKGTNYTYRWLYSPTATGTFNNAIGANTSDAYTTNLIGFYKVEVTLQGCKATSDAINVSSTTAMPKPIIAQGGLISFCEGGNVTLNALTKSTKYTYQWLFSTTRTGTYTNASGNSTQDSYATNVAGFYKLRTTAEGCGTAESDPIEIRVTTEKPKAEIIQAPSAQFCVNGGDVILEAVQGTGYQYQWKFSSTATGTYTNASGNSTQASYTANVAGFYVVEVTLNACITTSNPIQVTGTSTMPPATIVQSGVIQFCKGESVTLNAKSKGTNYQYQWLYATTATGTFTNASGNSTSPNYTATLAGFYRLRTTFAGCGTSTSDPIEVRETPFVPEPKIRQAPTISFCTNGDVFLEVIPEPNVKYTWLFSETASGTFALAEGKNDDTLYVAKKAGFYKVVATLGACVKTSEATEVKSTNMLPVPEISPSGRVFFCRGGSVVLRSLYRGTNITYQWQTATSATGTFTNVNGGNAFALTVSQAGFYRVTISATGCGTATSAVIEVVETTTPPVATILQGSRAEFCTNGGDVLLEAQIDPTYTYQWKFSESANGVFENATGVSNLANYLVNRAGFYRVEISVNGCKATSQPIQVVGVTTLSRPTIVQGTTVEFCQGDNAVLQTLVKGTGYVYRWFFSETATGVFTQASGNSTSDTYITTISGFYRLEISRQGCGSNVSETIAVISKPRPTLTFATPKTIEICEGSNLQLAAEEVVGASYAWRGANGFSSSLRNPSINNITNSGRGFYVLTITGANACTITDSVEVKVNPRPTFTTAITDNVCANDRNGLIRLTFTGNLQFRLGNTGNFQSVSSFNNLATGSYTVSARNEQGCESSQTVTIRATNPAGAQVNAGADVSIQKGAAVRLLATNAVSYRWSPAEGLSNPEIADPVASPRQTTTYTVTGTDRNGCTTTDEVIVTVIDNGEIVVKNLLTPDGNGINDTWEIINIERYPDAEIKVYDRWGLEVFSTVGYRNNWDGRSKSGEKLPDGAYYYQVSVTINGQRRTITGGMNIMR